MKKKIILALSGIIALSTFSMAEVAPKTFMEKKAKCQEHLKEMTQCVDKAQNPMEMKKCKKTMMGYMQKMHKGKDKMQMKCAAGKCGGAK